MTNQIRDVDYLVVSARVRAMEDQLLTAPRMERLLSARGSEEVTKVLQECGYPPLDATRPEQMDALLAEVRKTTLEDLTGSVPDQRLLDVFRLKYDYHNVKALLKARRVGTDPERLLMDMGRIGTEELCQALESGQTAALPPMLAEAAEEAKGVLDTTLDPQRSDIVLDRWYYQELMELARGTGSAFLQGYIRLLIDAVNLRTLVRSLRMGKPFNFLRGVLLEGGEIAPENLERLGAAPGGFQEVYGPTRLAAAAEVGAEAVKGGSLTDFEKQCDDAAADYLSDAALVPFGEAPVIRYLAARETEYTNLRILLLGRAAGLDAGVIRARLRDVQM